MGIELVITGARLLDRAGLADIAVSSGQIAAVVETGQAPPAERTLDASGNLVTAPFIDPHFHLDKVLSRDILGATSATEAFDRAREAKAQFTAADVEERASQAIRLAAAHGIAAIRAQVDVDTATGLRSLEGVVAARERFGHLMDIEVVAFPQEGIVADPGASELLRQALREGADLVGGLPEFEASRADQHVHMTTVFEIAEEFDVPVDMHIDYMDDPNLKTLEALARLTVERGFEGRVVADHCCALATYPDDEARRVIEAVASAEIGVNILPIANLQMLGGPGRTPTTRGSSRAAELLDAGVSVAAGLDNMYDIWFRFGRMDPAEVALLTCLSAGLRTDEEVRIGFEMTNVRAADVLDRPRQSMEVGAPADFVILNGSTIVEFMRNLPGRRTLFRGGREVAGIHGSAWALEDAGPRPT